MGLWRGFGARKDTTRGTAPVETRKTQAGLVAPVSGSYVAGLSGVLPSGRVVLVQGTAGWAYQVLGFHAVTSRGETDGVQIFGNDGPVTVGTGGVGTTVPAAPGSGLQRIDIVWVMHPSAGDNADTSSEPVFGVSSGTPASVPTAPTIPTGALELARNTMTSAATTTASAGNSITQTFRRTALRGAPLQVRDLAERTTRATQVSFGTASPLLVWRIDTGQFEFTTDGSVWRTLFAPPSVWTNAPLSAGWTTVHGSLPVEYRVVDGFCELRGTAIRGSGLGAAAHTAFLTGMPAATVSDASYPMLPVGVGQLGVGPTTASGLLNPRSDGVIRVAATAAVGSNAVVTLDGARYRVA